MMIHGLWYLYNFRDYITHISLTIKLYQQTLNGEP